MKRMIFICLQVFILSSCIQNDDVQIIYVNNSLVFNLIKESYIHSVVVTDVSNKEIVWKIENIGNVSDKTNLFTNVIEYGKNYQEFEYLTPPKKIEENIKYNYKIDTGNLFYFGSLMIENGELKTIYKRME